MGSCMSINSEEQLAVDEHEKVMIRRMRKREEEHVNRIYRSDEDRGRYIADPNVDSKAGDFINLFYKNRVMDETSVGHQNRLSATTS